MHRIAAHLPRLLACTALFLLARPLLARPLPAQDAAPSHRAPVCTQPRYVKPSDLAGIPGMYDLSNGDFLDVSREARHYYAEMGRTGRMEIIPLNQDEFVEKGGALRFRFDRHYPWSDVTIAGLDAPRPGKPACPP